MNHQKNRDDALIDATVMDDIAAMQQALDDGADVDARNDKGATALIVKCLASSRKRGANICQLLNQSNNPKAP